MLGPPNGAKISPLRAARQSQVLPRKYFKKFHFNNIEVIVGEFGDTPLLYLKNNKFDLIYFDGNHLKEPTIAYFEQCLEAAHGNSIFIFDDIHWTNEMEAAWDIIRNHKKVTLSIDSVKWGLVFFRKNQVKQHFTLRI